MTIGERVIELMRRENMTQKEFSEKTNIGQSTISDWKRKKINPASDKILIICDVLKISPEELLSGTETDHNKGRKQEYYIVNKDSEIGGLIREYGSMNMAQKERFLGYMEALREVRK